MFCSQPWFRPFLDDLRNQLTKVHPKTLFEIAMVLSTNSVSFPSNSHVSATFSILLRFDPGIPQIVRNSMLTGRRWEGRILINLCGNNNVRNCDLLQSDFFYRCRNVLEVAKGFFWYVVKPSGTRKFFLRHTWGVGWLDFSQKPSFSFRKSSCTTDRFVVLIFSQLFF